MTNAQRLALATCIATLLLISLGAVVRATGSGLGCPDWPTCHGGVVPPGDRHAFIESSHRYVGTVVGLLVIGTAAMAWRHYRHVPFVTWTATAAVPLVSIQGFLGAITVWRELPPAIVATHLVTAMLVLTCELAVAVSMYAEDPVRRDRIRAAVREQVRPAGMMGVATLAWLAAITWVGGYMAESGASTACADWPTCNGLDVLPRADDQEIVHMIHRYLAGAFIFFVVPFVVMLWRRRKTLPWGGPLAFATAAFYAAQVVVGAFNVWYVFPDYLTVSHTAIASGVWFMLSAAVLLAFYNPAPEHSLRIGRAMEATA